MDLLGEQHISNTHFACSSRHWHMALLCAGERFVMFANGGQVAGARNLMGKLVDTFFGSGMIMTGASPVQPQPCTLHGHAYPTLHAKCAPISSPHYKPLLPGQSCSG